MGTGNYNAISNNMKFVHWPLMGGLFVWYSDEGTGRGPSPPRPLIAVPNVTAHPSTANVPITVLMYNDPLPCGFNVPIKGLSKCLHGLAPSYRADDCVLASAAAGRRHLRSADTTKLLVRRLSSASDTSQFRPHGCGTIYQQL